MTSRPPAVVNLTLGTQTQVSLLPRAVGRFTEWYEFAASANLVFADTLVLLSDFGLSQNGRRMNSGFFTGSLFVGEGWLSADGAILPYGMTINSDRASAWLVRNQTVAEFIRTLEDVRGEMASPGGLLWNFESGNHFVSLCESEEDIMVVIHGGSSEFKSQAYGLYEDGHLWAGASLEVRHGREFRFLHGRDLQVMRETFAVAEAVVMEKHRYLARRLGAIDVLANQPHYGLAEWGVALGGHLLAPGERFLLLTSPREPILLCDVVKAEQAPWLCGLLPVAHGLGAEADCSIEIGRTGEVHMGGVQVSPGVSLRAPAFDRLWHGRRLSEVQEHQAAPMKSLGVKVLRALRQLASVSRSGVWTNGDQ